MNNLHSKRQSPDFNSLLLRFTAVLTILVLLSFHLLSGLLAKYNSLQKKTDSAHVAVFSVGVTGSTASLEMTSSDGDGADYILTLINDSDVAVSYSVTLKFDSAPPDGLSITLDGDAFRKVTGENVLSSPKKGSLAAHSQTQLTLRFEADWNEFAAAGSEDTLSVEKSFEATVDFVQIN